MSRYLVLFTTDLYRTMDKSAGHLNELLCRLSACHTHPVTVDGLGFFISGQILEHVTEDEADFCQLATLKRLPHLFTVDDESELVYANERDGLLSFFLQEQFTLARKNRLSSRFLIDACIQRFPHDESLKSTMKYLNDLADLFDVIDWKIVRSTFDDSLSWSTYKDVTLSRFFECLLVKLACAATRSWDLSFLKIYLLQTPIESHDADNLLQLFEHHKAVFKVTHLESGPMVSLKCSGRATSDLIVTSNIRKYLSGNMAYVRSLAVPLEVLYTEVSSKASTELQCYFQNEEKLDALRDIFEVYHELFQVTEDDKVYLVLCPFEDQVDSLREALCYFYNLLYALGACGYTCICYSVLMNCLPGAPSSVRLLLDLEYPNLALIDFFQSMWEFFDTSFKPNCVAPVLTTKLTNSCSGAIGIKELEALAVQQFASLLWVVPQELRIEILELCLDDTSDEVKEYCKERYPDGLSEFFLRYSGIFKFSVESKVVQLALNLPQFNPVQHGYHCSHTRRDSETIEGCHGNNTYEDLSALVDDVNSGSCPLTGFELLTALLRRPDCFRLEDGEVVLTVRNDLNLLLAKFDSKLDELSKAFKCTLFRPQAEVSKNKDKILAPGKRKVASGTLLEDSMSRSPSPEQNRTKGLAQKASHLPISAGTSLNFALMEAALGRTPDSIQALFHKQYPDGMAGLYGKYRSLFEQSEDGTVLLSQQCSSCGNMEDLIMSLLPISDDSHVYRNQESPEWVELSPSLEEEVVSGGPQPKRTASGFANLDMLLEIQKSAKAIKECITETLESSIDGCRTDHMTDLLRRCRPTMLRFCETHYHDGLSGFLKSHSSVFDLTRCRHCKPNVWTAKLHKSAPGEPSRFVTSQGKVTFLLESSGSVFCTEYKMLVHFPAWAFLHETQESGPAPQCIVKKGDTVDIHAIANETGRMTILAVAKVENPMALEACKASCECLVLLAGPYYSLLKPLRACEASGEVPSLENVKVFCSNPHISLRKDQTVRAEVKFNYPSRKLWQAFKVSDVAGKEQKVAESGTQREVPARKVGTWAQRAELLQGTKEATHKVLRYFADAIEDAGNDVPLDTLHSALKEAPRAVQDFCRQNFHDLDAFFKRFTNVFKVMPDKKVRAFSRGINVPARTTTATMQGEPQTHLPQSCDRAIDPESVVTKKSSKSNSSGSSERKLRTVAPSSDSARHEPPDSPQTCISRGLFGTITGLWEGGVQITSDSLSKPVEAPPAAFVQHSGTVSVVMTSAWNLGELVDFDTICNEPHGATRVTCVCRVKDKDRRSAIKPVPCICEVDLVTTYYALMTLCGSGGTWPVIRKRVVVLLSFPEKVSLTPTQKVTVEVRPGYPSSRFWKAERLLDPQPD